MSPKQPDNERYMVGWFLVKYGDAKRARAEAKRFVQEHRGSKS